MFDNSKIIKFEIVTPEKVILKDEIFKVTVPTKEGEITVLPQHMPIISILIPGIIELTNKDGEKKVMSVSGGFIEVLRNKVIILADTAERAEEIDIKRAEEAKKRAEESIKNERQFDKERYTNISTVIAKELARTRAVKRWKNIRSK